MSQRAVVQRAWAPSVGAALPLCFGHQSLCTRIGMGHAHAPKALHPHCVDFGQLVSSQEDGEGAPEQGQPQLPSNELAPLKAAATPRSGSGGMANGGDAHSDKQSAQQELMSAH
eukprot:scaffold32796_cov20-Tisochrysis_lutea.AAC.1